MTFEPCDQLLLQVNGKTYPQAKLELGKMGALHPANRLAAYITGRICPVSQSGPNVVTSTVTKASTTSVPVSTVSTVTTVTSMSASTAKPLKSVGKSRKDSQFYLQTFCSRI